MTDLRTTYLGLELAHPVVASAGPATGSLASIRHVVAAGAAAIVLPSLFEEEVIAHDEVQHALRTRHTGVYAEAFDYLPDIPAPGPAERYLDLLADAVRAVDVPVIASLNGTTAGGWLRHAAELQAAGAAAIELNVYLVASDPMESSTEVEHRLLDLVHRVRAAVRIPVAVKLSPSFSSLAHLAVALTDAGADGLVLFNRFYQPDFDLDALQVTRSLELSTPADLRLPLRWVGILREHVRGSLALSSGVHSPEAVVKGVLAGADVVMTTAGLLRHGPSFIGELRDGMAQWFETRGYDSVAQARGSMSRRAVPDPDAFERANYYQVIHTASRAFAR